MVSDSELIERLREFLRNSDLNTTTTGIVRRKLEEDFGVDLTDRKLFIREQVDMFLQSQFQNAGDEEDDHADDDGDQTAQDKSDEMVSCDAKEEEEDDEEATNGKSAAKRGSEKHNNEGKKRGGGFTKLCSLSPQLQGFLGVPELARTEVVKQLWAYIREHNLQDPNDRRTIICDEQLHSIFNVDSINMFQMNKALSKHIWPLESDDVIPVKSAQKEKQQKHEREEDEQDRKEKRQKGGKSGLLAPLQLSDALVKFLGTGEIALSRADVIKRMWEYIKQNNLQDPSDKRRIICDEKLKELFDVDSFHGFTVSKLLSSHFIKT